MLNDVTRARRASGIAVALFAALIAISCTTASARDEYRIMWVDIFHPGFRTAQEIDTMLQVARAANYNAVLVQARKACDAFYNSSVEPKNSAVDRAFDPLDYAIRQAHDTSGGKRRIEVHAWLVAYRCRMPSDDTWKNPKHVYQRHPEWLSQTFSGKKEDTTDRDQAGRFYLDPGVPQVTDYNLEVVRDLLSNYPDLDGLHFDYVRYPETKGGGNMWGYNPISVARFNTLYGRTGKPAPDDAQWCEFRRQQVVFMVRKVYAHVRAWRPNVKVSGALITWGSIAKGFEKSDAYGVVMQDWEGLARAGFLDLMIPMNYKREGVTDQARQHREWAQFLGEVARTSGRFGVNGVDGEELNSLDGILAQARATRNLPGISGIATYCYAQCRKGSRTVPDLAFFDGIRKGLFTDVARVPEAKWLTRPTEGIVKGIITRRGKPVDGAIVRIGRRTAMTDGSGFYAIARLAPGTQEMVVEQGGQPIAQTTVNIAAGQVTDSPLNAR